MTRKQWRIRTARLLFECLGSAGTFFAPPYDRQDAMADAGALLRAALRLSKTDLARDPDAEMTPEEQNAADTLAGRRSRGEPFAYLTGTCEFYGRDLLVSPSVLIPRPETETLIEEALRLLPPPAEDGRPGPANRPLVIDIGTGSGCIALTLLAERPFLRAAGVDISRDALQTAAANAEKLGFPPDASGSIVFAEDDMTAEGFAERMSARFGPADMIVSNPPYVTEEEYERTSVSVRAFEPKTALTSPDGDGLPGCALIAAVIRAASSLLRPGGALLIEHGCSQGAAVRSLMGRYGFSDVRTVRDLAGMERCTAAVRPGTPHAEGKTHGTERR